ncbi:hypothetical protein [Variovorax sp. UC74_104]|uniref:hypothetical protein n=1 Tax=Variovorax sp. UC74_104 TaxID=3374555 RepID=UPI003757C71D
MEIIAGTVDSFSAGVLLDMARYRHQVFVEKLGWKLDTRGGSNSTSSIGKIRSI